MRTQKHIVLDGHDGAGKTTLAMLVAREINAKYVKPFADTLGDLIAWSFRRKQFDLTNTIALAAIEKIIDENSDEEVLVFDRHWLSMFTVLPKEYHEQWKPLPFTVLCWADEETTRRRLAEKGEKESLSNTRYYCELYKELAREYGVPVIDTTKSCIDTDVRRMCSLIRERGILAQMAGTQRDDGA